MKADVSARPYRRTFSELLKTAHGDWKERKGFIMRVASDRAVGYGEIAPLPEFGTETLERARNFLEQWVDDPIIMPSGLPCCSFALTTAIQHTRSTTRPAARDYAVAGLLPAGTGALTAAKKKLTARYSTLKWKIGVQPFEAEKEIFKDLIALLPRTVSLRLDANGGLGRDKLEAWLEVLSPHYRQVEFLEQPLPPGAESQMAELAQVSKIRIALDESLNAPGRERLLTPGTWDGPLVIKPLLMGNVTLLAEQLKPLAGQLVFSSVFETGIGLSHALELADALPEMKYALGFDTSSAFNDTLSGLKPGSVLLAKERGRIDPESIWKQLPPLS